jgi:hypothetical protein
MALMKIAGLIRGAFATNYPEGIEGQPLALNSRSDLSVAQGLPALTELVRMGQSFQVMTATPIAALTAVPTTAIGLGLWNGEPGGGKSYAIDSFGCIEAVADATQQNQIGLWAINNVAPVTAPTAAALTIRSTMGRIYDGKARPLITGQTVANDGWFPHGQGVASASAGAVAGGVWRVSEVPVRGLYLVQPSGLFAIHATKVAATASQLHFFLRWHEVQLAVRV